MEKMFRRGNGEKCTYSEMTQFIADYIAEDTRQEYDITIGTDSQNHSDTKMVEVIAVHRVGHGGIFFCHIKHLKKIRTITEKIYEETRRSLENARGFIDEIQLNLLEKDIDVDTLNLKFQIHCDIGHKGKTQTLIKEITSWVTSMGYECLIKPDSYTASGIANKFSK